MPTLTVSRAITRGVGALTNLVDYAANFYFDVPDPILSAVMTATGSLEFLGFNTGSDEGSDVDELVEIRRNIADDEMGLHARALVAGLSAIVESVDDDDERVDPSLLSILHKAEGALEVLDPSVRIAGFPKFA